MDHHTGLMSHQRPLTTLHDILLPSWVLRSAKWSGSLPSSDFKICTRVPLYTQGVVGTKNIEGSWAHESLKELRILGVPGVKTE